MSISTLVIGYGSIGRRHCEILSSMEKISSISVLTQQEQSAFKTIRTLDEASELDPDYIVIACPTSRHFEYLEFLDKSMKGKTILVEKPLFDEYKDYLVNNYVVVGYNLRFNPVLGFIKEKIRKRRIWSVNIFCGSNLENWRVNTDYKNSSSAKKEMGGGVLLDLSHELDYIYWLFGNININFSQNLKLSNLEINTDDFLHFSATTESEVLIQTTLNYFSKIARREIFIDGENICIKADLITNEIEYWSDGEYQSISFNHITRDDTFRRMHEAVILRDSNLCTYEEGLEIMKLIEAIRSSAR